MNEIDKVINEINLGQFEVAFPKLKPNEWSFMVFNVEYDATQRWSASFRMGLLFRSVEVNLHGFDMHLTGGERKRLNKALSGAYDKTLAAWKERRAQIKAGTDIITP